MPAYNDSQKIYKKMSEENQPLPQTIIKGNLLRTAHQKLQLKQRTFSSFSTRLHMVDSKQSRINHQSDR